MHSRSINLEVKIKKSNLINQSKSIIKQMLKLMNKFEHHANKERTTTNLKTINKIISLYHQPP